MTRNVGEDAAVLGRAPTGADRRRPLVLVLLSVPCARAEKPGRIAAHVESEIDVALIASLIRERRTGVAVVAELVSGHECREACRRRIIEPRVRVPLNDTGRDVDGPST